MTGQARLPPQKKKRKKIGALSNRPIGALSRAAPRIHPSPFLTIGRPRQDDDTLVRPLLPALQLDGVGALGGTSHVERPPRAGQTVEERPEPAMPIGRVGQQGEQGAAGGGGGSGGAAAAQGGGGQGGQAREEERAGHWKEGNGVRERGERVGTSEHSSVRSLPVEKPTQPPKCRPPSAPR